MEITEQGLTYYRATKAHIESTTSLSENGSFSYNPPFHKMPISKQVVIGIFCILSVGILFNLMVAAKVIKILFHLSKNVARTRSQMYNSQKLVHTFIYVLALSLVDATILLNIPLIVTTFYNNHWLFSLTLCRLHLVADNVNKVLSTFILTAMSFDRYLIICHPTRFGFWQNKWVTVAVLIIFFILAALLLYPYYAEAQIVQVFVPSKNMFVLKCLYNQTMTSSADDKDPNLFITFGFGYCLPLLLMSFFYCSIVCELYTVSKRLNRHSRTETTVCVQQTTGSTEQQPLRSNCNQKQSLSYQIRRTSNARSTRNWTVTKRVSFLVAFYFTCWTPHWFIHFYVNFGPGGEKPWLLMLFMGAHILVYCNSAINPLLYALLNSHLSRQVALVKPMNQQNGASRVHLPNVVYQSKSRTTANDLSLNRTSTNKEFPEVDETDTTTNRKKGTCVDDIKFPRTISTSKFVRFLYAITSRFSPVKRRGLQNNTKLVDIMDQNGNNYQSKRYETELSAASNNESLSSVQL